MVAKRGVMFVLGTELAPDADKALSTLEQRIAEIEKRANAVFNAGRSSASTGSAGKEAAGGAKLRELDVSTRLGKDWRRPFDQIRGELNALQKEAVVDIKTRSTRQDVRQAAQKQSGASVASGAEVVSVRTELARDWRRPFDQIRSEVQALQKEATVSVRVAAQQTGPAMAKSAASGGIGDVDQAQVQRAEATIARLRQVADREEARDNLRKDRAAKADQKRNEQNIKREEKFWADRRRMQQREQEQSSRAAEAAQSRLISKQDELRERTMAAMGAVTTLGRGFATLGLIGEEDMAKLKDRLLAIVGTVDMLRGGIQVWHELSRGARTYREILVATAAAERAAAVTRGVGGAVGAASAIGGAAANVSGAYMLGSLASSAGAAATRIGAIAAPAVAAAGALTALAAAGKIAYNAATGSAGERYDKGHRHYQGETRRQHGYIEYGLKSDAGDTSQSYGSFAASAVHGGRNPTSRYLQFLSGYDIPGLNKAERHANGQKVRDNFQYKTDAELAENHQKRQNAFDSARAQREQLNSLRTAEYAGANANRDERLQQQMGMNALRSTPGAFAKPEDALLSKRRQLAADRSAVRQRERETVSQLRETIGPMGAVGPGRDEAIRARAQVEQQVLALREREIQLAREQRSIDIDAGRQRLQLARQTADQAKDKFTQRLQGVENFQERLGRMTPDEVRALAEAKRTAERGGTLKSEQLQMLELGDQRSQDLARQEYRRRGRQFSEQNKGAGFGDIETLKANAAMDQASRAANARDAMQGKLERDLKVKLKTNIDNQVEVEVTGGDELEEKLQAAYQRSMGDFMREQSERVERWLREASNQTDSKISAAIRQQNNAGRQLAR